MSDAPEFIYARPIGATVDWTGAASGPWALDDPHNTATEYIRADLSPQWQPIETAPRDGTSILTYPHFRVTHWAHDVLSLSGSGWAGRWDEYMDAFAEVSKATHWMLLPKPPTE